MLWFVISIPIIIIGIAMIIIGGKLYPKYESGDKRRDRYYQIHVKGMAPLVIGGVIFIAMGAAFLISISSQTAEVNEINEEYYFLTLTYESEEFQNSDFITKHMVYEKIVDYNNNIEYIMKKSKSPWTNHLYPDRFWSKQDLKLIELE